MLPRHDIERKDLTYTRNDIVAFFARPRQFFDDGLAFLGIGKRPDFAVEPIQIVNRDPRFTLSALFLTQSSIGPLFADARTTHKKSATASGSRFTFMSVWWLR